MKKSKFNGKDAEECRQMDWESLSENFENEKKAKKRAKYEWDVKDVDESWSIDFDDNGRRLTSPKPSSVADKGDSYADAPGAVPDSLGDSIVLETINQIASEDILKADGAFVTGEIDAGKVNKMAGETDSKSLEPVRAKHDSVKVNQNADAASAKHKKVEHKKSEYRELEPEIAEPRATKARIEEPRRAESSREESSRAESRRVEPKKAEPKKVEKPKSSKSETKKHDHKSSEPKRHLGRSKKVIIKSDELKEAGQFDSNRQVKVRNKKDEPKPTAIDNNSKDNSVHNVEHSKYKRSNVVLSSRDAKQPELRNETAYWNDSAIIDTQEELSFADRLKEMTVVQYIAVAMAIVLVITGVMTTGVYAEYRSEQNKVAAFANLPSYDCEGAPSVASNAAVSEEVYIEEDQIVPEEESKELSLVLTSVEKDLKIKLVDGDDSLVKGIPWGVTVADADGNETDYEDDDKDGIIHLTDLSAGDYTVALKADSSLEGYDFPQVAQQVSVKAKVEYKVIANIKDEIKKESEVNVALEDPNGNKAADVETGTPLADTVDWVESTKVTESGGEDEYEEAEVDLTKTEIIVAKATNAINALKSMAKSTKAYSEGMGNVANVQMFLIRQLSLLETSIFDILEDVSDDSDEETDKEPEVVIEGNDTGDNTGDKNNSEVVVEASELESVTISKTSTSIKPGDSASLTLTYTPSGAKIDSVEWESSNENIATVSDGVVTGKSEGTARITAKVNKNNIVFCDVTVSEDADGDDEEEKDSIVLAGPTTVEVGEYITIEATLSSDADFIMSWEVNDASLIEIVPDGDKLMVKGLSRGKATIKAVSAAGIEAKFDIQVLVDGEAEAEYSDDAQLYDSSKNELYVLEDGKYRLAKYSDYKSGKYTKFYRKAGDVLYTGWQTIDGVTYYYTENHEKVTGDQVIGGVTYHFGSDGALSKGSGILGIDVSKYQPSINWSSVKASGVNYVIIRCGYRGASTGSLIQDPYFFSHIKGAKDAGLKVGVYFFSTALNEAEAVEEASMCAELCSGYGINYPVFIDVESSTRPGYNSLSVEERTANIKAFCSTIQSAGYTPGLYANKTWLTSYINTSQLSCKIWLAQYNASGPTYNGRYDMWQYTSKGRVDGISGNVDMNQSYLNY